MSEPKLGEIITGEAFRDAIHIAVAPVIASGILKPGEDIALNNDGLATSEIYDFKPIGIVDPFLKNKVKKGEKFYLFLYPKSTTGLRHVWTCPDFPDENINNKEKKEVNYIADKEQSIKWIEDYASSLDLTYNKLMTAAADFIEYDSLLTEDANLEGRSVSREFWRHYGIVTGRQGSGNFFNCSC